MPIADDQFRMLLKGCYIMDDLRQYILSVIAAALICSIVNSWIGGKGTHASVIKLISGLLLTITIVSPLLNIQINDPEAYFDSLAQEAEAVSAEGQFAADKERNAFIKESLENIVQEKAISMNTDISVDITLNNAQHTPQKITLAGTVSPYSKRILSQYIQENLGIPEEDQMWK